MFFFCRGAGDVLYWTGEREDCDMVERHISCLDLDQIAASGQCFTWQRLGEGHYGIPARGSYVEAEQRGERLVFSCGETEFEALWADYFDLSTDYEAIQAAIDPADGYLRAAARYGRGIRVLRQDLWEVLVSFLISQNNNIGRITRSVQGLCRRWGEERRAGSRTYWSFPSPAALVGASESDFAALGLGYRARYLVRLTAEVEAAGYEDWARRLRAAGAEEAMERLTGLYGVGKKVAQCVCLFGLHQVDAFPVDTHIRRVLEAHYPAGFDLERYKGYGGILQQYLFYYDLSVKK